MLRKLKWAPCVWHREQETDLFINEYFACKDRSVLLIAGAGFDPRATAFCQRLSSVTSNVRAYLIQEERPDPVNALIERADNNIIEFKRLIPALKLEPIDIFDKDNAVIGGRNIVKAISQQSLEGISDVVVDISAMSIGICFPLIRYLIERIAKTSLSVNLHLFVMPNAKLDESIIPIAGDTVGCVHGFRGKWALDESANSAKLWLPQLAFGRKQTLQRIYDFVAPDDTCPILPFPSTRPRLGDELGEHYLTELESTWEVDPRNVIYAAEDDPLDLYRTVLRIDDLRRPVFEDFGGSQLVLSPTGSKILALGALMAALERELPVVYLEAIGYEYKATTSAVNQQNSTDAKFSHIWLAGDAYSNG